MTTASTAPTPDTDLPTAGQIPLPKDRNIYFTKQFDQSSIADITKSILEINRDDEYLQRLYPIYGLSYQPRPIKIYIDSYGGYVYQCFGLLSVMNNSKTPIHTIVTGAAMSCGFMMLIHGHRRFAMEHATAMYHQVSGAAWGKVQDMEENLEETKRLQKAIMEMTVKRTKIGLSQLEGNLEKKRDWYMDADEALKLGVVDEIIGK
jgi:ATP-dependent Clp protease, protease subunit